MERGLQTGPNTVLIELTSKQIKGEVDAVHIELGWRQLDHDDRVCYHLDAKLDRLDVGS
jgi:hypothetical protein